MATLFICNLSKQHHQFLYRVAENQNALTETIPMGGQVQIPGDLTPEQIEGIVSHHRPYGLKSVAEARKIKGFTGLIYDIGKPVDLREPAFVNEVSGQNDATLNERSAQRRVDTTAAISKSLEEIGAQTRQPLQHTEVEVMEDTDGTPKVAAGVEVAALGTEPRNVRRR
jgi:hypothetical protein